MVTDIDIFDHNGRNIRKKGLRSKSNVEKGVHFSVIIRNIMRNDLVCRRMGVAIVGKGGVPGVVGGASGVVSDGRRISANRSGM